MFACCMFGGEEEILDPPGDGPTSFTVQSAGLLSSHYNVLNPEGSKWLRIKNDSGFFDPHCNFDLETRDPEDLRKALAKCVVGPQEVEMKRNVEWDGDSDDSDFSIDDLFDMFDDDEELKVKLKWKVKREARFMDEGGNEFARLTFKVKGKSKAEIERDDDGERTRSETKVKKVYYTLSWGGEEIQLDFDNRHWGDYKRVWDCDKFKCEYVALWGTDKVQVDTKDGAAPSGALLVAFAIAYFFHPSNYCSTMDSQAQSEARSLMRY